MNSRQQGIKNLLSDKKDEILDAWMHESRESGTFRRDLMNVENLRQQSRELLDELIIALESGYLRDMRDTSGPAHKAMNEMLIDISGARAKKGYSPRETAFYVFSLGDLGMRKPVCTR